MSWLLHNALPGSISFEEWFRLSAVQRRDRLAELRALSPVLQREPSDLVNYEAQQAPLAYLIAAPVDAVLSRAALRARVLALRLVLAVVSAGALFGAASLLLSALGVGGAFRLGALACIFECQMLWGSVAHVGNDWLAVPVGTLFLALLILAVREARPKYLTGCAGALAGGLLTKAYFLAFAPVFAAAIVSAFARRRVGGRAALTSTAVLAVAAPWYARNLILYGSLGGTQESIAGVGFSRASAALLHINWIESTVELFRWALWTGNWSFVSFSRLTLDIEMALIAGAFVLLFRRVKEMGRGEWWAIAGCAGFFAGLIYQTCVTWVATNGRSQHAEPWYVQCILPCIWALTFKGLQRGGAAGRVIGTALVAISCWIAAATYLLKLIPLYGGFTGRATLSAAFAWWRNIDLEVLAATLLGPLPLTFGALAAFLLTLAAVNAILLRSLLAPWAARD